MIFTVIVPVDMGRLIEFMRSLFTMIRAAYPDIETVKMAEIKIQEDTDEAN